MRKFLTFFFTIFLFACSNVDVQEEELENTQLTSSSLDQQIKLFLDQSDPKLFFVCTHLMLKKYDDESEIKNSPGSIDLDY